MPFLLLLWILSAFALSGCWNQREPQNHAIILALGVDFDEAGGLYEVFVEIAIPTALAGTEGSGGGGGGQPTSQVLSARGYTLFDALRNLEPFSPRELYWGHSELVIISEALARRGLIALLDFYERERHSRLISRPLVANGDMRSLLQTELPLEESSGLGFMSQVIVQELNSATAPVGDLRDTVMMLSQPGVEPFMPRIRQAAGQEPQGGAAGEGGGGSGEEGAGGQGAQKPQQVVRIEGGAAFRGERLVGFLGTDATRGWLWITGNVNRATEMIPCPDCSAAMSVEIIHFSSRIQALVESGKPKIVVSLNADSRIQDQNCKHPFSGDRETIVPALNRMVAEAICRKMEIAVAEAQALQADIFGFGREFYRRHPHQWQLMEANWPLIFEGLEVELKVEANLRRVGLVVDPIEAR